VAGSRSVASMVESDLQTRLECESQAVPPFTPQQSPNASEAGRVVLSTWAFARVGDMLVLCTRGEHAPPEADFAIFMQRLTRNDYKMTLIHAIGGMSSPKQRGQISEYFKSRGGPIPPCAVLTDSVTARAVMTALSWLRSGWAMKSFPLGQLEGALHWLDASVSPAIVAESIAGMHAALRSLPERRPLRS